jgi:4-amino-4-deoxy-L-arabinose transferase-like glycosyltransferase
MISNRPGLKTWSWVLLGAALWIAGLAMTPLTESTEGRYVSVGAEMVRSGNWLEPNFDGLPHYTKPPWAYWAIALSLQLLPESEWAARLPATMAALVALALALSIARGRESDRVNPPGSSAAELGRLRWMLLASPIFLGQARLPSGDVYLVVGILAVVWALLRFDHSQAMRVTMGAVGLAIGILAKGHIIFLWTLVPALLWWLRHPKQNVGAGRILGASFVGGTLLALPWFWWASGAHPDLINYWLGSETANRVLTDAHSRSEAWWYYLAVIPLAVLPWMPEAIRAMGLTMRTRATSSLLLLSIVVPTVVLQLSVSKRPNYVLPLAVLLAILASRIEPSRWFRARCIGALLIMLVGPIVLSQFPTFWPATKQMAAAIPDDAKQVLVHHELPSSLPFYLEHSVTTLGVHREERFASQDQRDRWVADNWDLGQRLQVGDVILSPRHKRGHIAARLGRIPWRLRETVGEWELLEVVE